MNCPVCDQSLVVVERESIELDWCLSCRGFWFDEGELELLAEKTGRRLEPEDVGHGSSESGHGKSRKCPRCRRRMERKAVGADDSVLIDRCNAHGIWLDKGELGRLIRQLAALKDQDETLILEFLGETFSDQLASSKNAEGLARNSKEEEK